MTTVLNLLPLPVSFWLWSEHVQMPQRPPALEQQQGRDQRAAEEPIGTECHPAAIQLAHSQSNLQEVPPIQNTT